MYRTVVLALDASEGARRAFPKALELAHANGARLVIAHARTHSLETQIEAWLAEQVETACAQGIDCTLDMRSSLVAREADVLNEVAEAHDADLIVIAGRGRSSLAGAVLGSVTQRLLHLATCPVLVIPTSVAVAHGEPEPEQRTTAG